MALTHAVEYSKSSRAKCHGPVPCKGTLIDFGTLRYGQTILGEYGETVEWRHWGCVTPAILGRLAPLTMDRVAGFQNLRPADQQKIRRAISLRHVDRADIPPSAKIRGLNHFDDTVDPSPGPSQKKRKATHDAVVASSQRWASQSKPSQILNPQSVRRLSQLVVEEEFEEDTPEEEARDELYCSLSTNVVGVQYYKGLVGPGEEVVLVRQSDNQYDRNAVQVNNIGQTQVGHVPRQVASKLAPLLDRRLINVEGVIHDGNLSGFRGYSLSMTLKIYGGSDKRDQIEPLLIWATPGQRGFPPRHRGSNNNQIPAASVSTSRAGSSMAPSSSGAGPSTQRRVPGQTPAQLEAARKKQEALLKAAELKQMLNNLEKVDDDGRRTSLLDTLCSKEDILNLPLHPNPPGIKNGELSVDLLKHQRQALQWCIEHEHPVLPKKESDKPVQFWQLRKNGTKPYYYNIATKTPQEAAPMLGRGALCADSMGLGKTLTMLALIIATKKDVPPDFSKCTLIVVPLSVLSNWEKQIEEHCTAGTLSSCVYYGANRSMSPKELQKFDVVITTYQTVVGEHVDSGAVKDGLAGPSKKKKKGERNLFEVQWKRVVLDEGHSVRNPKTKMARAVCGLNAERRWVLSGTPIINSPRDLGSILTFLQICRPLDKEDFFKRLLLRPLKDGDPSGAELLRVLMSQVCIRRTKEMQDSEGNHLVPLPPVEMIMVPVTLSDEARAMYDEVEKLSKQRFENYMNRDTSAAVQSNVLSMLTRLRQLALHPGLVPANYVEELRAAEANDGAPPKTIHITVEDKIRLQRVLGQAIEDCGECPICFGILDEARITSCSHIFCLPCITEVISRDQKCPMDRRSIQIGDLIEPVPPTDLTQIPICREREDDVNGIRAGSSAKIDQLVHLLKLTPPTEKSLVFSQFTSFLDKIAEALEEQGIPYIRFDGQMAANRRQENIARFSIPLEDNLGVVSPAEPPFSRTRNRGRSSQVGLDDTDSSFGADEGDSDFAMNEPNNDDDDFLDDQDVDKFMSKRQNGKEKAKGKGKAKSKSESASRASIRASFDGSCSVGENPKVMLISLKAGALGLNLTVANNVYLMDPWWQEGIESQAIDRCNRIGQKKPVHVYQLIAEKTVESKVIEIQERKKQLIQQAFSGLKRTETPRQKKEARLQDLIELFGVRQAASRIGN